MFNREAIYPAVTAPPLTAGAARLQAPSGATLVTIFTAKRGSAESALQFMNAQRA
jgi:hypothetical protein